MKTGIEEIEKRNLLADYIELFTENLKTKVVLPTSLDKKAHLQVRQAARVNVIADSSTIRQDTGTIEFGQGVIKGWSYGYG